MTSTAAAVAAHMVGDYVVQTSWMAERKTTDPAAAAAHAAAYTACFLPLTRSPRALAVIGGTHYLIDRYRLAQYVGWAKNQVAPASHRYPLSESLRPTGYHRDTPPWLATWLMIITDNLIHTGINITALRRLT